MNRIGYYDFEGNTVLYEGGEDAYDLDSREWIPVDFLFSIGEFIGETLDYNDEYEDNMFCDNTGLCNPNCHRLIGGECGGI